MTRAARRDYGQWHPPVEFARGMGGPTSNIAAVLVEMGREELISLRLRIERDGRSRVIRAIQVPRDQVCEFSLRPKDGGHFPK